MGASRSWKRPGSRFSPRASKRSESQISLVKLVWNFWPSERKANTSGLFEATRLVEFVMLTPVPPSPLLSPSPCTTERPGPPPPTPRPDLTAGKGALCCPLHSQDWHRSEPLLGAQGGVGVGTGTDPSCSARNPVSAGNEHLKLGGLKPGCEWDTFAEEPMQRTRDWKWRHHPFTSGSPRGLARGHSRLPSCLPPVPFTWT